MPRARRPPIHPCPFTIIVDVNEYLPHHDGWRFDGLFTNADMGSRPIDVKTETRNLHEGDYAILEMPAGIIVERKTKADLFGSMATSAKRTNFEERLALMQERYRWAAVVVEADWYSILTDPPEFTDFRSKSVFRTVIAWMQRFPGIHWLMMPDRTTAQSAAFRLMERYWLDREDEAKEKTA